MSEKKIALTQKDINGAIARWYFSCEIALNFERMQALAFCYALQPVLKKLYPDNDKYIEALQRHLELFNINTTAGGLVLGTVLAMEEEKANNYDAVPGATINALKTGLMGPVSAFGDSFSAGTITTLFILAACNLASNGSIAGLFVLLIGSLYTLGELIVFTNLTYKRGKSVIKDILGSQLMNDIIEGANILGMTMMGAMCATMVNLSVALTPTFGEGTLVIQDKLDAIMPGILPLGVLFIYYWLISKKNVSVVKLVLGTIVVAIVAALVGLF